MESLKSGLKSSHGHTILLAGLAGLILSDLIPTPSDAIYFSIERNLRDKWKKGEIQPKEYWTKTALYYYSLNPLWWALVAGITLSIKGDTTKKLKIAGALIGVGAVAAIIYRNIKKDEMELAQEESLNIPK